MKIAFKLRMKIQAGIVLLLAIWCVTSVLVAAEEGLALEEGNTEVGADFELKVQPFFEQHCIRCHGPDKEKGGLRIDQLTADLNDLLSLDHLHNIIDELAVQEMPPEDEPQPDPQQVVEVMEVLREHLAAAKKKHNSGGGKPARRLTRTEFINTVWDLMGVHMLEVNLPPDGTIGNFDTDATSLYTTDMLFKIYLEEARGVVRKFIASRSEEPGEKEMPVKFARLLTRGELQMIATDIPAAGYLKIKTAWWKRDARSDQPIYLEASGGSKDGRGGGGDGTRYALQGTDRVPQWIEKKYFIPSGTINWSVHGAKMKGVFRDKGLPRDQVRALNAFKISNDTIVEAQSQLFENPVVLGAIQNFQVINPQPYEFFNPILRSYPGQEQLPDQAAPQIIERFVDLMSRGRGADELFVKNLVVVFQQGRQLGEPFWEALVEPMAIAMCSMESLFHIEDKASGEGDGKRTLSGAELANRLSYIMWRSAPDKELLELALSGMLLNPEVKSQQVSRMIKDEKFDRFVEDFSGQWLELERQDVIAVDSRLHGQFPEWTKQAFKLETKAFVAHVIRNNLQLSNFIDSDFIMVNNATADHYGVTGSFGHDFVPVQRPDPLRGGLLTQAGILLQTGTGDRTSIVERGAFISRKMLGIDPPPPPPDVDPLPVDNEELAKLPAAELVKHHVSAPQCASCHMKIDPMGIGLEEFDAVGRYRMVEKRLLPGVDSSEQKKKGKKGKGKKEKFYMEVDLEIRGHMPEGDRFVGVKGLKQQLMARKHMLAKSFVEALFTYANGRKAGVADATVVDEIVERTAEWDYPSAAIMWEVLNSDAIAYY